MRVPHTPRGRAMRAGGAAVLGLATIALTGTIASASAATTAGAASTAPTASTAATATSAVKPGFTAIKDGLSLASDKVTGSYAAKQMSVEIALAPRDQAGLTRELDALYTKGSGDYHQFLAKGQFDRRYAPAASTVTALTRYLDAEGLSVAADPQTPFLIEVTGSSARVAAAFHTTLHNYIDTRGVKFFANSQAASVPASLAGDVLGVVGLTDTVRLRSLSVRATGEKVADKAAKTPAAAKAPGSSAASCEASYPTTAKLIDLIVKGDSESLGYGGGPDCTGLTPSQTNSIYNAPAASGATEGSGVGTALFELSAYVTSNPATWAQEFYGTSYSPDITSVNVDGGPLSKTCPSGDSCSPGYSGDIEVDADIEQEMAVAPDAHIYVYNAPNDETGQTSLDEYNAIADADTAATVSSSWGLCEADAGESYAEAENTIFEQMAAQGQSVFAAAGDSGAFDCLTVSTPTGLAIDDPGAQPWVISAGGDSLGTDNPGTTTSPGAPKAGVVTVWNPDNLCGTEKKSSSTGNESGYWWCGEDGVGGGGGGSSGFWGAPSWQTGAGVDSTYAKEGTSSCALAASSTTLCRQVPDVSANADEFTPYAEYCTGTSSDSGSDCAEMSGGGGWFGIGGTSLSAPLWGALIADRDSYQGAWSGNVGSLLYGDPSEFLTDIAAPAASTETGYTPATENGYFPTTAGYDEATGLGEPNFSAIIEG
ncbi:MAG TPA: S53 family peptidase [Trebonia sp.]|jgi:subtilase family serine protease|nr:S53 family peptidase [Trebonia sp.]